MIYLNGKTESNYNADYIHWECSPPEPKIEIATVPLRDGAINLTSMLSDEIHFGTRTITIGLELRGVRSDWPTYYSKLLQDLHGQSVTVERSEEDGWYWEGWASVGPLEDHGASAGVTITVTAQPYKITTEPAEEIEYLLNGTISDTLVWDMPKGFPEIETSAADMTIKYNDVTWTLPSGISEPYGLVFTEGNNDIVLHGNGAMTIRVKGGSL